MEHTKFNALNYLLNNNDDNILAEIIQWWEDWRGANGAEDVYNLKDKGDFLLFVEKYGVEKAVDYYNNGQFYLDGMNFTSPVQMDTDYMLRFIHDEYDLEYFKELHALGWFDTISKWFDTTKIKEEFFKHYYTLNLNFTSVKEMEELKKELKKFLNKNAKTYHYELNKVLSND